MDGLIGKHTKTDRQIYNHRDRKKDGWMEVKTERWTNEKTDGRTDIPMDKWENRGIKTDKQIEDWTEVNTD